MATVTTPVEGFTGTVAGVDFTDGVGDTADPNALAYFTRRGYGVDTGAKPAKAAKRGSGKKVEAVAEGGAADPAGDIDPGDADSVDAG